MLDAGLRVLGRNEPFALRQADVCPARLPCLADTRAVAKHHQRQQAIDWFVLEHGQQACDQFLQLSAAQPGRLDADLGFREVAELNVLHRVGRDQPQFEGLPKRKGQQLERRPHVVDADGFLRRPHELIVQAGLVDAGQRYIPQTWIEVALDQRSAGLLALVGQAAVARHAVGVPVQQLAGRDPLRQVRTGTGIEAQADGRQCRNDLLG
ncbi:hypothetical protein ALQ50_200072 [Pseudomonas coronafaciens pv. coronafaciens]|nr:hypothetical protein ALQ50_200072 [Pseudomonas coronafaciens pv. coronafaciens]